MRYVGVSNETSYGVSEFSWTAKTQGLPKIQTIQARISGGPGEIWARDLGGSIRAARGVARARGRVGLGLAPPFWASPAPCLGSALAPPVARGGAMSERSRWRRLAPRLPRRLHCVPALPAGWLRAWAVWDGEICH